MSCVAGEDAAGFGATWACGGGTACTTLAAGDAETHGAGAVPAAGAVARDVLRPPLPGGRGDGRGDQPFNDRFALTQFAAFAEKASPSSYTCRPPRIGVPGGMAYRQCNEKDRAFASFKAGQPMPREICGLTGGKAFDLCVATGNFDQCLSGRGAARQPRRAARPTTSAATTTSARRSRPIRRT